MTHNLVEYTPSTKSCPQLLLRIVCPTMTAAVTPRPCTLNCRALGPCPGGPRRQRRGGKACAHRHCGAAGAAAAAPSGFTIALIIWVRACSCRPTSAIWSVCAFCNSPCCC